jgi:hypothetical protein
MKLLGGWGAMHIGDKNFAFAHFQIQIELIKALD